MINLFIKQIGIQNFFWQGLKLNLLKKFKKEKFVYKTITKNNYNIYKWDPSAAEVYMTQCFMEWGNEYLFLDSLENRKNTVFLDVGCHSGYYPSLLKNFFEKIIGFEPSRKCFNILKNLNNNKFSYYQCFVGDKSIKVKGRDSESGYSFYDKNSNHKQIDFQELNQITLDEFCKSKKLHGITAIKIDVDGIDLKVLYGGKEIIKSNRPSILIENYSKELFEFFKNLNYSHMSMICSKEKPYNLNLEELKSFDPNKWRKMVCCIPSEYKKNYENTFFEGNIVTGINKKKILKTFNFKF